MKNIKLQLVFLLASLASVFAESPDLSIEQQAQERVKILVSQFQQLGLDKAMTKAFPDAMSLPCEKAWYGKNRETIKQLARDLLVAFDDVVEHMNEFYEASSVQQICQHPSMGPLVRVFEQWRTNRRSFLTEYVQTANDVRAKRTLEQEINNEDLQKNMIALFVDPANDVLLQSKTVKAVFTKDACERVKNALHTVVQELIRTLDKGLSLACDDVLKQAEALEALNVQQADKAILSRQAAVLEIVCMRDWILPIFDIVFCSLEHDVPAELLNMIKGNFERLNKTVLPRALQLLADNDWFAQLSHDIQADFPQLLGHAMAEATR